jgi:hypothetical protein
MKALPSLVNGDAWSVRPSSRPTEAFVIPNERVMVAPEDESAASGAIRAHELLHVRWSMECPFPEHLPLELLQSAEDGRVHTLAREYGIAGMFAELPLSDDDARAAEYLARAGDVRKLAALLVCGLGVLRGARSRQVVERLADDVNETVRATARAALARANRCAEIFDAYARDVLSTVRVAEILAEDEPDEDEDEDGDEPDEDGDGDGDGDGESKPDENGESKPDENGESKPDENGESKPDENGESKPENGDEDGDGDGDGKSKPENGDEDGDEDGKSKPDENGESKPENGDENGESKPENGESKPEPFDRDRLLETAREAPTMTERESRERERAGERAPEPFAWADPVWRATALTIPVRATTLGAVVRNQVSGNRVSSPARYATDGRVFGRRLPGRSGAVLLDGSGSCSLSLDDLEALVRAIPAGIVAAYDVSGAYVLARDGKRVRTMPRLGGSNSADGPMLEWLASRPGPRVFLSDGEIHEQGSRPDTAEYARLDALVTRARIVRVHPSRAGEVATALAASREPSGATPVFTRY